MYGNIKKQPPTLDSFVSYYNQYSIYTTEDLSDGSTTMFENLIGGKLYQTISRQIGVTGRSK